MNTKKDNDSFAEDVFCLESTSHLYAARIVQQQNRLEIVNPRGFIA